MIYLQLFYEFFKVGLFAFGGGLATIPFLYDIADRTGWFTYQQLADMVAVSESTPGPIGINMATYVGFTSKGILGAVVATFGLVAPSVILILIVAKFLKSYNENKIVRSVFYGIRPASTGLIAAAGYTIVTMSLINIDLFSSTGLLLDLLNLKAILLAIAVLIVLIKFKKINPIFLILLSAVIGMVFSF
ncbi:MAG: chromate transporter [Eubacteriales bacterium]